jgi:hypothetical protein
VTSSEIEALGTADYAANKKDADRYNDTGKDGEAYRRGWQTARRLDPGPAGNPAYSKDVVEAASRPDVPPPPAPPTPEPEVSLPKVSIAENAPDPVKPKERRPVQASLFDL